MVRSPPCSPSKTKLSSMNCAMRGPRARLSAAVVPKGGLPTLSRVFSGMPDTGTDEYSIEIRNIKTGQTVILTSVDMTDQEKSVVVRQLLGYPAHRQAMDRGRRA